MQNGCGFPPLRGRRTASCSCYARARTPQLFQVYDIVSSTRCWSRLARRKPQCRVPRRLLLTACTFVAPFFCRASTAATSALRHTQRPGSHHSRRGGCTWTRRRRSRTTASRATATWTRRRSRATAASTPVRRTRLEPRTRRLRATTLTRHSALVSAAGAHTLLPATHTS